jgi:hypothetical protein
MQPPFFGMEDDDAGLLGQAQFLFRAGEEVEILLASQVALAVIGAD